MMDAIELFGDERRRHAVRHGKLNGISDVETRVGDRCRLRVTLFKRPDVEIAPANLRIEGGVRIRDVRVTQVSYEPGDPDSTGVLEVEVNHPGDHATYVLSLVRADARGAEGGGEPLPGFDPVCSRRRFRFRDPAQGMDCRSRCDRDDPPLAEPDIDYLARDYASFRQLAMDRLALLVPQWQETHVPDIGVLVVELLAYAADRLSYQQDAVATEAYLGTARKRISVRRHARLVDYAIHEGCNARAWIAVDTAADVPPLPARDVSFVAPTASLRTPAGRSVDSGALADAVAQDLVTFEPVSRSPLRFRLAHSRIPLHTWGCENLCLPRGATSATLVDAWEGVAAQGLPAPAERPRRLQLAAGDFLLLMEVVDPDSGLAARADPAHRHVVRLTKVEPGVDPLFDEPDGLPVVHIEWAAADALPFALAVSRLGPPPQCRPLPVRAGGGPAEQGAVADLSIACGNIVLADQGRRITEVLPDLVRASPVQQRCVSAGLPTELLVAPLPYRATLRHGPLTWREPVPKDAPAVTSMGRDPRAALPQIELDAIPGSADGQGPLFEPHDVVAPAALVSMLRDSMALFGDEARASAVLAAAREADAGPSERDRARALELLSRLDPRTLAALGERDKSADVEQVLRANLKRLVVRWHARRDLLESGPEDDHYVVEIGDDGLGHLRFGDGDCGRMPAAGTRFFATYRVGSGPDGNVGVGTLTGLVVRGLTLDGITVGNPLPARGGLAPEAADDVRRLAPTAYRGGLHRAVTADDYGRLAERDADVQRAAATLRWNGNRFVVRVALDPLGVETPSPALLERVVQSLERYRRIGHDVEAVPARYVPLDIAMSITVDRRYQVRPVHDAVLQAFGQGTLPDGTKAFFHPDNLSFGVGIDLSRLIERAQRVEGVESVRVTRMQRLFMGSNDELERGLLSIGPLEIARLDNDPDFPERGRFQLHARSRP